MSDHYVCKACDETFDRCKCDYSGQPAKETNMSLKHTFKVGMLVRVKGGEDVYSVFDVEHQHMLIGLPGLPTTTLNLKGTSDQLFAALEIVAQPMSEEERQEAAKDALTLIWLNDWSADSGAKTASEFADEVLTRLNWHSKD